MYVLWESVCVFLFVWGVQILIKLQWEVHRAVRNYGESLTFAQSKNKQENRKMEKQQTNTTTLTKLNIIYINNENMQMSL